MEPATAVRLRSGLSLNSGNPMENILVAGVNTRPVACSLKRLGYNVYSSDYFGVMDLKTCVDEYNSILDQQPYQSCGHFTEKFSSRDIESLSSEFTSQADSVLCLAGVSTENFPKNKVLGNRSVEDADDKLRFYRKLKDKFNFPSTFSVSGIGEAREIADNHQDKQFIIKPIHGSGGYGIRQLEDFDEDLDISGYILQEELTGLNVSASVLSTGSESRTILTSQQIIADTKLYQREPYGYCGNITPLTGTNIAEGISRNAEDIIDYLKLVGSNGVDFIIKHDELFVIEVNPRIQGTMECAELTLKMNLVEAHIAACQGELMDVPPPSGFAVKMIVHAKQRSQVGKLNFNGVYDLPRRNAIIEGGEPVVTVLNSGITLNETLNSTEEIVSRVYSNLKAK